MNMSEEKIYKRLQSLQKERDELTQRIKQLNQTVETIKKTIHHTEAEIALDGAVAHLAGLPDFRLANDLRELKKEKNSIQSNASTANDLSNKLQTLTHEIDQATFWMHYANSQDVARQQEAERRVFG